MKPVGEIFYAGTDPKLTEQLSVFQEHRLPKMKTLLKVEVIHVGVDLSIDI